MLTIIAFCPPKYLFARDCQTRIADPHEFENVSIVSIGPVLETESMIVDDIESNLFKNGRGIKAE
jgi:hypothetical protein